MAMATHMILLAGLGLGMTACMGGSPGQYRKIRPAGYGGQWQNGRSALAIGRIAPYAGRRQQGYTGFSLTA
jgi:hypothetical protein